mgnify:CR=1 FL=1
MGKELIKAKIIFREIIHILKSINMSLEMKLLIHVEHRIGDDFENI